MRPLPAVQYRPAFCLLLLAACVFLVISLSGCGPQRAAPEPEKYPAYKPPVAGEKKPKPYKVLGQWYQPMSDARGYREKGIASWYGKKFHGRKTSNGETYDMYGISAAHKTLPLGTWVRVVNLNNQRTMDIRINDRGPFVRGRIIDLSYGAAKKLEVIGPGTAPVEIAALGIRTEPGSGEKIPTYTPVDYYTGVFTFQVGAFLEKQNAEREVARLDPIYKNVHMETYEASPGQVFYRVRVGRCTTLEQAAEYEAQLVLNGFPDVFTVAE